MKNNRKKILSIVFGIIILFLIGTSWFYPYSFLSLNKSISYHGDPVVVKEYLKDLNEFKKTYDREPKNGRNRDLTMDRTQYILQMYEQEWLTTKKTIEMDDQDLKTILFEVKATRKILIDLAFQETYSRYEKDFLKYSIENCLAMEESIEELQDSTTNSKNTLNRQYRNLHMSFVSSFLMFRSFYEEHQRISQTK